jgi:hypothetical protein
MGSVVPRFDNYRLLFEMLDREPMADPARVEDIAGFEARWGCRVPASVREWFSFAPATVQGCHPSAGLLEWERWQPDRGILRGGLPQRLYLHRHDGDEYCYVPFDQGDDPPVKVFDLAFDTAPAPPRDVFSKTFSRGVLFWGIYSFRVDYWARAAKRPFTPAAWDALHERFPVAEDVRHPGSGYITFIARGGRLRIAWGEGDPRSKEVPAGWVASGVHEPAFRALVQAITPWVDLLHPAAHDRSPRAGETLQRLSR